MFEKKGSLTGNWIIDAALWMIAVVVLSLGVYYFLARLTS